MGHNRVQSIQSKRVGRLMISLVGLDWLDEARSCPNGLHEAWQSVK